uniref:WD_REPEATS_REGION domain-containing protein n=1 Tax=Steinernema glaseri TaxID=37863 RepID=A0A1I7ZEX0_9BILA
MVLRMRDDVVPSWVVNTTAIGVNSTGQFISGGGDHFMFANTIDSIIGIDKIPPTKQTSFTTASYIKWHPQRAHLFASVCSQFVGLYQYSPDGRLRTVNAGRLHPRKINDIDWSCTDDNTFMTCADGEPIALWDCRSSLKRATYELQAITGAEQAKFAPNLEYIVATAHGSDIRIWDDRYRSAPAASIIAHSGRITSLAWHPTKNTFVTSGTDGYIKIWDFDSLPKPIHSFGVLQQPVQKIRYSLDGEQFVTLPRAGAQAKTALTIWQSSSLTNLQALKSDEDPIIDVAWQHFKKKKFLFTLRKSGVMRRYSLISNLEVSGLIDMPVPILQTDNDKDVDKLVPETNKPIVPELDIHQLKLPERTTGISHHPLSPPNDVLPLPHFPGTWCCWLKAKSKNSNNLGSELEALRKLQTEGLITNEINFNRAACGFTYEHKSFAPKKIYIEIRFHASFIKNHAILVKIHEKNCALDADKALALLKLIEEECRILRDSEETTTLHPSDPQCVSLFGRVLQKLPELINALQIPGTHIDIPARRETSDSCHGRSVPRSDGSDENSGESEKLGKGYSSIGYTPSPLDDYVPAPRTCAAHFNMSGYLIVFGKSNSLNPLGSLLFGFKEKSADSYIKGMRKRPRKLRSARSNRTVSISEKEKSSKKMIRSLRDYEIVASAYSGRLRERTSSDYSLNFDNLSTGVGVVGGNMWEVLRKDSIKQPIMLGSSPSRSIGMQNISFNFIAQRNRGNSLTCPEAFADESYRVFATPPKPVLVYDVERMLPFSRVLAQGYKVVGGDTLELIRHNMKVASSAGREDLVRAWMVIEQIVKGTVKEGREEPKPPSSPVKARVVNSHTDGTYDRDVVYADPSADDHEDQCSGRNCLIRPIPWAANVAGRRLINGLIANYIKHKDYQMASVLGCILRPPPLQDGKLKLCPMAKRSYVGMLTNGNSLQPGHVRSVSSSSDTYHGGISGHNTIHGGATFEQGSQQRLADVTHPPVTALDIAQRGRSYEAESTVTSIKNPPRGSRNLLKKLFGGTDTPSPPPVKVVGDSDTESEVEVEYVGDIAAIETEGHPYQADNSLLLFDPTLHDRFTDARYYYADLLYKWKLYVKCAEIMKYNTPSDRDPGILQARYCPRPITNYHAGWPQRPVSSIICSICQMPCKGQLLTCNYCRHGGHMEHMTDWFLKQTWCPSGCGCICLIEMKP